MLCKWQIFMNEWMIYWTTKNIQLIKRSVCSFKTRGDKGRRSSRTIWREWIEEPVRLACWPFFDRVTVVNFRVNERSSYSTGSRLINSITNTSKITNILEAWFRNSRDMLCKWQIFMNEWMIYWTTKNIQQDTQVPRQNAPKKQKTS